jgi:hypothetical protein
MIHFVKDVEAALQTTSVRIPETIDLSSIVEKALTKHGSETLCENCFEPHSAHSNFGDFCPVAWPEPMGQRKFSPLYCSYVDPRSREGREDHCHAGAVVLLLPDGESARCMRHAGRI